MITQGLTEYLDTLLHGDQVAALFIMLVTYLAFLVMKSSPKRYFDGIFLYSNTEQFTSMFIKKCLCSERRAKSRNSKAILNYLYLPAHGHF